ncbi:hypothetical protein Mgra_00007653 [Meloidogyne graminicola]|uniref:Uncharacterized protein n=1 Tax=Meloidogyne graminicola TaxID=189291 RepID=A0A8S9ZI50_9BILA|nr:hypothetical protein Mgra_00007653 [Meloidogyne graminicola]
MCRYSENFGILRMLSKIMVIFALFYICQPVNCSNFFNSFHPKRITRALDMLEGDDFIGMQKRKRALDMMEGDDFIGLRKRAAKLLLNLRPEKRALDILEGDDFIGMQKRAY